ncbi:hypothetical protein L6R46_32545, partial [Myxococcota bacterium]|nr:hypothetical protein [Myxococcota bacterium]
HHTAVRGGVLAGDCGQLLREFFAERRARQRALRAAADTLPTARDGADDGAPIPTGEVIEGDLFTQVEQTITVLQAKYLKARITYEGTQRVERFPVPEPALREAITNAIVHKDYAAGAAIHMHGGAITCTGPGSIYFKASLKIFNSPGARVAYAFADLPKPGEIPPNRLVVTHLYHDNDPVQGADYEAT